VPVLFRSICWSCYCRCLFCFMFICLLQVTILFIAWLVLVFCLGTCVPCRMSFCRSINHIIHSYCRPGHSVAQCLLYSMVVICASVLFRGVQPRWTSMTALRPLCPVSNCRSSQTCRHTLQRLNFMND